MKVPLTLMRWGVLGRLDAKELHTDDEGGHTDGMVDRESNAVPRRVVGGGHESVPNDGEPVGLDDLLMTRLVSGLVNDVIMPV